MSRPRSICRSPRDISNKIGISVTDATGATSAAFDRRALARTNGRRVEWTRTSRPAVNGKYLLVLYPRSRPDSVGSFDITPDIYENQQERAREMLNDMKFRREVYRARIRIVAASFHNAQLLPGKQFEKSLLGFRVG